MSEQFSMIRPIKFEGTKEQLAANRATHRFWHDGDFEYRCCDCDCKPWHAAASYPCGKTDIPWEKVTFTTK